MSNFKTHFLAVIKSLIGPKFIELQSQIILGVLYAVVITLYY